MANVLAIISKAQFETLGKGLGLGDVFPFTRYASAHRALEPLANSGSLYLVTVRPPDESLWLVAVLRAPTFDGSGWVGENSTAIADVSACKSELVFENGKGLSAKPGALGMSLQTPRTLTLADSALLEGKICVSPVSLREFTNSGAGQGAAGALKSAPAAADQKPAPVADLAKLALCDKLAHHVFSALGEVERNEVMKEVQALVADNLDFVGIEQEGLPMGKFVHRQLGATMFLIPGGRYLMGWSKREDERLRELVAETDDDPDEILVEEGEGYVGNAFPPHEVDIAPFFLAQSPLNEEALAILLDGDDDGIDSGCLEPEYLKKALKKLEKLGLRLPSEAEWEYAARAGSTALFPGNSDDLPDEPEWPKNNFGLEGLGALGDLCIDEAILSPKVLPADGRPLSNGKLKKNVMRGGSAMVYPWQGPNWVMSLCAARSSVEYEEFFVAIRPARKLFDDELAYSAQAKAHRASAGLLSIEPKAQAQQPEEVNAIRARLAPYALESCVPTSMYGKAFGDLYDLTQVGMKEKAGLALVAQVSRVLESGFTSGDTVDLMPHFFRLLLDRRLPARAALAKFVTDRIVGVHTRLLPTFEPGEHEQPSIAYLFEHSYQLVTLLLDEDNELLASASLLAALGMSPDVGVSVLEGRLHAGLGDDAAAHVAVALGALGRRASEEQKARAKAALYVVLEDNEEAILGQVACVGLALLSPNADEKPRIVKQLQALAKSPHSSWALANGDMLDLAVKTLRHLDEEGALKQALLALCQDLVEPASTGSQAALAQASRAANALLIATFDFHPDEPHTLATLTEEQRAVVTVLSHPSFAPSARYHDFGLPLEAEQRRALLGQAGDKRKSRKK